MRGTLKSYAKILCKRLHKFGLRPFGIWQSEFNEMFTRRKNSKLLLQKRKLQENVRSTTIDVFLHE